MHALTLAHVPCEAPAGQSQSSSGEPARHSLAFTDKLPTVHTHMCLSSAGRFILAKPNTAMAARKGARRSPGSGLNHLAILLLVVALAAAALPLAVGTFVSCLLCVSCICRLEGVEFVTYGLAAASHMYRSHVIDGFLCSCCTTAPPHPLGTR